MSVTDFLFEGKAPAPVTQYGSTVETMPQWMSDYANTVLNRAAGAAEEPYQPYTGPRIAPFSPDQLAAFEKTRSTVAGTPGPLTLAAPYLATAGKTFPEVAASYMNPYMENVTNRAATLAKRSYAEDILPQLQAKFGNLGQDVRSSAYRGAAERGARDVMENLNEQNLAALAQGYTTSGQQFTSDAARAAQLGLGMGPLSQYALEQGLTGAGALGGVGAQQQALAQKSADLAYQDFLRQQGYPEQQVQFMQSILQGMPHDISTARSQDVTPTTLQPSGLAQLGSTAGNVMGLLDLFGVGGGGGGKQTIQPFDPNVLGVVSARGGPVRHAPRVRRIMYSRGGPLRYMYAAA